MKNFALVFSIFLILNLNSTNNKDKEKNVEINNDFKIALQKAQKSKNLKKELENFYKIQKQKKESNSTTFKITKGILITITLIVAVYHYMKYNKKAGCQDKIL